MLRPATEVDKESVRTWRNHPAVRSVSLTRGVISPQEHDRYWAALQDDPSRIVLMYERGGTPSGVVTFFGIEQESGERRAMWGYYLDNAGLEARGELLPAWIQIQREAVRYAFGELGLEQLDGEVLDANEAVRRMNTRNGFEEISATEHTIDGERVLVHTIRRRRQPNDRDK
ncbi:MULTISPECIES: GNAT family N-acetyltransferase [unclassified Allobranchiibius]|uniref:GNAT family N-acetyltransferase n=1 Tax=unclassified Allobranchiibius TaxID=2649857 RepID=UPI001AA0F3C4|nr:MULTISPECIES: GNAT family N-acetyltransferase [unclassified Allobranchiibius]MBO1765702.1 GNAT family N-acetyltransferase [Allobranchiibius sp. GilTou38]UIJ34634.1 GNAT family N-acetyltransferase [Allobranchiibius sp. GilTou73]